ncbi:MAG: enzyme of heme biosynthesis [Alistipes sp.]|nr:enzyme of heme biosynthesis [Candidatus Alistipes equi]
MLSVAGVVSAQDFSDPRYAKWGDTPEQRKNNILASQFLKEEISNHRFNEAAKYLQQLIASCPGASENTYANGITLYKQKINRASDLASKKVFVDSMLWLYDKRLEHFGSHPKRGKVYLLERKAREYLTYKDTDREGVRKVFEQAIEAQKEAGAVDPEVVAIYFKNLCDDYSNDIIDALTIVNTYDACSVYFENLPEDKKDCKAQFEQSFAQSGAASCQNLETIFSKKLATDPENETLLNQAVALMSRAKCDSDFFLMVAERLYKIKPTAEAAYSLASVFQNKGNYPKALEYVKEALGTETDDAKKEDMYVRIGILNMSINKTNDAIEALKAARELNSDNGLATFFLAQCYVMGACGEGITRSAIYWYAYDLMQEAIPDLAEFPDSQASAKDLAQRYRSAFPSKEDCFFNELKEGSVYTIKCGAAAGRTTTVRYR